MCVRVCVCTRVCVLLFACGIVCARLHVIKMSRKTGDMWEIKMEPEKEIRREHVR